RATDLFKTLFRATPDPAVTTAAPLDGSSSGDSAADEATTRGFGLGPLRLHPSLAVNYWEGVSAVGETAKPQRHRYLEVQPGLVGNLSLFDGRLKLGYEPRLRGFSTVPAVN